MKTSSAEHLLLGMIVMGFALRLAASPAEVDSLVRQLRDPAIDANGKGEACLQLMDLGPAAAPAVPALVGLLTAPEELLRDYAVTTLDRIGPPARNALPALRRVAAQDSSAEIRGLARAAITKISGSAPVSEQAPTPSVAAPVTAPPAAPLTAAVTEPEPVRPPEVARPEAPAAPTPAAVKEIPAATPPRPAAAVKRPSFEVHAGHYFRWAAPVGWIVRESTSGVTLTAPDGTLSVNAAMLMRMQGRTTPEDFTVWMLGQVPDSKSIQVVAKRDLRTQPSGLGGPWNAEELEIRYALRGIPVHGIWITGIVAGGNVYDACMIGYQGSPTAFERAKPWLPVVACSISVTDPDKVAASNRLLLPSNRPLDSSALLESWRQKGLSEDRISKAQRGGALGYERVKDAQTGRIYEMPLEAWDDTAGGYRNPQRPGEILQPTSPGE
jgi:hypothetical protein